MKKGRFLWSAHRITEKQKVRKARNIKGNRLENSRNMVSKRHVVRLSSARDNILFGICEQNQESRKQKCFRDFLVTTKKNDV